jgi:hypothetical protein
MYTEQVTEAMGLSNGLIPETLNNGRDSSDSVDLSLFKRAIFILMVGANAGSLSAWLQESADNSSWTANDTAGSFTNSGGSNVSLTGLTSANKIYTFEVRADQLTPGKRYVRLQAKSTTAANITVCIVGFGLDAVHKPGKAANASNVVTPQNVVA